MKAMKNYKIVLLCVLVMGMLSCKKSSSPKEEVKEEQGFIYESSSTIFPNPERGVMKMFSVYSEGTPLTLTQLQTMRANNISLIQRIFYFNLFKDKALSQAQLTLMQTDFNTIRQAGLKVILRFAYTDVGDGADAPLAIVEQHLDQLQPLFQAHQDVIAFVQAGFIGPWGEWHSSTSGLGTAVNQSRILNKLLSVLPSQIMVQVRTPAHKRAVFNTTTPITADIAYTSEARARVGHHNDCFLTGGTDYGTYVSIQADKQYISNEALYVPTGGETCPPSNGYAPTCVEARNEMMLLKWTYLNLDYFQPTLNLWRNTGCFEELERNMGYRLSLFSSNLPETSVNNAVKISVQLTNYGFAPVYHKKNTLLVLKNKQTGQFYEKALAYDVRTCKPGTKSPIEETVNLTGVPAGDYALYLKIEDQSASLKNRKEYAIRLANNATWEENNGGINSLLHSLKVN